MPENNYKLVFEGKIIKGHDLGNVKSNLMSLLKTNEKGIQRLFSGQPVVVKKDMDKNTAMKYKQALNKAGALCKLETIEESGKEPVKKSDPVEIKPKQKDIQNNIDVQASEMMHCPKCNYKQKTSDKCIMCGSAITEHIPAQIEPPQIASNPVPKKIHTEEMILTNIESIPGWNIVEHFGLVSGSTIRAKHIGRDIMAGFKNLIGGELKGYTQLMQESREQAVNRMKEQARQFGANAIVNIRFSTSSVAQGAAELYAYGTAVRIE